MSSGLITTQAPISGVEVCAVAFSGPKGRAKPTANPPPAAADVMRNERRFRFATEFMIASPYTFAAMCIASRTCWKVPQRQMLVIAALMSASVGFGFSLRRAATAMIIPLWQ